MLMCSLDTEGCVSHGAQRTFPGIICAFRFFSEMNQKHLVVPLVTLYYFTELLRLIIMSFKKFPSNHVSPGDSERVHTEREIDQGEKAQIWCAILVLFLISSSFYYEL